MCDYISNVFSNINIIIENIYRNFTATILPNDLNFLLLLSFCLSRRFSFGFDIRNWHSLCRVDLIVLLVSYFCFLLSKKINANFKSIFSLVWETCDKANTFQEGLVYFSQLSLMHSVCSGAANSHKSTLVDPPFQFLSLD